MAKSQVFISYKRLAPWSEMAHAFHLKLENIADAIDCEIYIDKTMEAAVEWTEEIDAALARTTHLVAFLCDEYWSSEQCKRELHAVLRRYEAAKAANTSNQPALPPPRLLFVRAGDMNLKYFTFDQARKRGALSLEDKRIGKLSDLNFLGPYDLTGQGQLETMSWDDPSRRDRQLGQLRDRLIATLK